MPSLKVQLQQWIDDVHDIKLDSTFVEGRPVFIDKSCRLDCQGVTSSEPKHLNLQVQVNNQCDNTTMAKLKPKTIAWCLAPVENP
jgi:hypothetical protein